ITLRLRERLEAELCERNQERLFFDIEMPLVPVLVEMERRGVALDVSVLHAMSRDLHQRLQQLEEDIYRTAGHAFNINSTQQLAKVLFDELGLKSVRRTQTGHSTDAAVLEALRGQHPIIELILEHRQLGKLKSTYVDALPLLVNRRTGRVHTSFNQAAVVTGRLSSSDPNLQNIPVRTELGSQIRRAFVAPDGWCLLSADYSQVELRILAHVCGDQAMLDAFARGEDIHARTAATLYGVPLERVTPQQRYLAKTVNFGVIYGMGDYGLAQRTELSQAEAARFIESYFARFPAVQAYLEETRQKARREGYVETLFGRRRYFPELAPDSKVPMGL
ncbi:MAG: DNA polymerase, partial [Anaerolineae bacterium]|nr:DNA polymerase [Anaerolineae bacterium]